MEYQQLHACYAQVSLSYTVQNDSSAWRCGPQNREAHRREQRNLKIHSFFINRRLSRQFTQILVSDRTSKLKSHIVCIETRTVSAFLVFRTNFHRINSQYQLLLSGFRRLFSLKYTETQNFLNLCVLFFLALANGAQ